MARRPTREEVLQSLNRAVERETAKLRKTLDDPTRFPLGIDELQDVTRFANAAVVELEQYVKRAIGGRKRAQEAREVAHEHWVNDYLMDAYEALQQAGVSRIGPGRLLDKAYLLAREAEPPDRLHAITEYRARQWLKHNT